MGICDGRVVIVTGSGRGIGREHALAYAAEGAKVVVNDLGGDMHGDGGSLSPAMEVVEEIKAMGGEAVADGENVADFAGAGRMVQRAIDTFGHLDTLVNNAGILRDRMLANMEESEWDAVIAVHLKGAFAPTRHAAAYWRDQAKAGTPVQGRIVNTSSPSGIFGNAGQTNYGAAKAGIAAFTIICGLELGRYGVLRERDRAGRAHAHDREPRASAARADGGLRRARPREHLAARRVARLERQRGRERPRVPRRRRPRVGGRGLAPRPDRPQQRDALGARAAHEGRPRPRRARPAEPSNMHVVTLNRTMDLTGD